MKDNARNRWPALRGTSSLFNRLVERERAIVTATPGTTRDLVSETVSIGGIPIRLVDTAGIRRSRRSRVHRYTEIHRKHWQTRIWFWLFWDVSQRASGKDEELLRRTQNRPVISVGNKCDLAISGQWSVIRGQLPIVKASALTGEGIDELRGEILRHIGGETEAQAEAGFLTNVRHQGLVRDALGALDAATAAVTRRVPHEMLLLDLYDGLRALDAITGATTTDDILNLIFSTFCIGK